MAMVSIMKRHEFALFWLCFSPTKGLIRPTLFTHAPFSSVLRLVFLVANKYSYLSQSTNRFTSVYNKSTSVYNESKRLHACQSRKLILKCKTFIVTGTARADFEVPTTNKSLLPFSGQKERTSRLLVLGWKQTNTKEPFPAFILIFSFCAQNEKQLVSFVSACVCFTQET